MSTRFIVDGKEINWQKLIQLSQNYRIEHN